MHPLLRRPVATALSCMAVTLSATACGPFLGDLTRPQILGEAIEATESAKSVTVHNDILSLAMPIKGYTSRDSRGNCIATRSYGAAGRVDVIKIGDKDVYLRRDEASLRSEERHRSPEELEALVDKVGGRWTKPPVDGPDAPEDLAICNRVTFDASLEINWEDDSAKGDPTTVDGRKALKLVKAGGENETAVYIAAEGPPYILKIVMKGGDVSGTITYSHYDRPVEVTAPPAEDIVAMN
ncbi:hypothetical protein R1T08_19005 [Streptomyces sp. SBC-4]|nr:hypothetical protein [Streptomyces sp. SBC-4]MDV5146232.1 hypothetical protein [Streptomyces sp. SBC-4]